MGYRLVTTFLVTTLTVMPLAAASAAETLWTQVTVRVYDATGTPTADRQRALDVASAIVAATSIGIVWMVCDEAAGPRPSGRQETRPCPSPLRRGELALRIVRSPAGTGRDAILPLGEALIDMRLGEGVLATVYADRVASIAAQTGVNEGVLLGRAIAHELGHLLLATNTHAPEGLMRALWSRVELRRLRTSDWAFRRDEIAAISARALAR